VNEGPRDLKLAGSAERALVDVLERSETRFGAVVRDRYARLVTVAFADLAHDPDRTGVRWIDIGTHRFGLYHIRHSRSRAGEPGERVRHPRHIVVFRRDGDRVLEVIGILHDSMLPDRHLIAFLIER